MFRQMLFVRIVPNLKRLGLLSPRVREAFERLGILEFENADPGSAGPRARARLMRDRLRSARATQPQIVAPIDGAGTPPRSSFQRPAATSARPSAPVDRGSWPTGSSVKTEPVVPDPAMRAASGRLELLDGRSVSAADAGPLLRPSPDASFR